MIAILKDMLPVLLDHAWHVGVAYLLALPIGWDREKSKRQFGLRTFPLVAVVTCGFVLIGLSFISGEEAKARVIQGIVTGIGFIGGGAILRDGKEVLGTASATSLWNTGAIGMAVGFDSFEIAILLSVVNIITLVLFGEMKKQIDSE